MSSNTQRSLEIALDTSLILKVVKYYSIIGAGLGLLGIILFSLFSDGSAITSVVLLMIVLSFSILSGPIIAAFISHTIMRAETGDPRQQSINSSIANGIGFIVFGIIVAAILLIGTSLIIGGSGGGGGNGSNGTIQIGRLLSFIFLMSLPNAFVGGGIAFFSTSDTQYENTKENTTKREYTRITSTISPKATVYGILAGLVASTISILFITGLITQLEELGTYNGENYVIDMLGVGFTLYFELLFTGFETPIFSENLSIFLLQKPIAYLIPIAFFLITIRAFATRIDDGDSLYFSTIIGVVVGHTFILVLGILFTQGEFRLGYRIYDIQYQVVSSLIRGGLIGVLASVISVFSIRQ